MMARQRIASYEELAARLCAAGVPISRAQAWRLVTLEPQRIRIRVLAELCDILRCSPADLLLLKHEISKPHAAVRQELPHVSFTRTPR